jgi:putative ABC transport system ATP-binding protein
MLEIRGLRVEFPNLSRPVLTDISLSLDTGEFCVLIGKNASGKSTLVKSLLGEHRGSGEILLHQRDISKLPSHLRAQRFGVVSQNVDDSSIAALSVLENLSLAAMRHRRAGFRPALLGEQTFAHSPLLRDLRSFFHSPLEKLSGGQRQRVALAMALCAEPDLLLLDEHCSALDPKAARELMELTEAAVLAARVTTLVITHRLGDALRYGTRLIALHQGRIVLNVCGEEKRKLQESDLLHLFEEDLLC